MLFLFFSYFFFSLFVFLSSISLLYHIKDSITIHIFYEIHPPCLVFSAILQESFIPALLRRLGLMLQNPLPVNILITAIISRLAALPQPLLRDYLLDPTLPLRQDYPSLFRTLDSVSRRGQEEIRKVPMLITWMQEHRDSVGKVRVEPKGPLVFLEEKAETSSSPTVLRKITALLRPREGASSTTSASANAGGSGANGSTEASNGISGNGGGAGAALSSITPASRIVEPLGSGLTLFAPPSHEGDGASTNISIASPSHTLPSSSTSACASPSSMLDLRKPLASDPFSDTLSQAQQQQPDSTMQAVEEQAKEAHRRTVLGLLVFEEFLKEVAALCIEQSYYALGEGML